MHQPAIEETNQQDRDRPYCPGNRIRHNITDRSQVIGWRIDVAAPAIESQKRLIVAAHGMRQV